MLDLKTKCCPRPKAEGNFLSEGPTYHMLPESPVNNCFVIPSLDLDKVYSIQIIHKQTDHDTTGLYLDELIWDELALV